MTGDNYLKTQEYADLIEELDDLYRYRCGQHSALNDAYANGRDDEREEREPLPLAKLSELAREAQIKFCLKSGGSFEEEFARAIERAHGIGA